MRWWPFPTRRPLPSARPAADMWWPLDLTLLNWAEGEPFTLDDACKGVQVFGMTGSGKTSGSGRYLALSYLTAQFGGLVLCAKPGEADTWRQYAREAGRESDLVVFSPTAPWRFNFLDHELQRPGTGAGLTENLVGLFAAVADLAGRGAGGGSGREDEGYWRRSLQQLLRNAIDLLVIATGKVSVPDLYRLVVSAPTALDQPGSDDWRKRSFCWGCLVKGEAVDKPGYRGHDFQVAADYWLLEFPALSDKTRSVIVSTFTSMADVLNRGVLRELFCTETTVTPDDCLAGKVVVVDLPVKEYADVGLFAAAVWKHQFQRAVERRPPAADPRPCFLFADEAHLFTGPTDALFQTTARSARCCTVYLTQNLNNYLSAYKGESGRADALSLLGNLTTTVVHCLGDADTAKFVADLIGRRRQWMNSGNFSYQSQPPLADLFGRAEGSTSGGYSETFEYAVQPNEFGTMRTGGPASGFVVDALVWRGGRPFAATGRSYLWTHFDQRKELS